jgi:hypothetical protein
MFLGNPHLQFERAPREGQVDTAASSQVRFCQSDACAAQSKYSDFMDLLSTEHLKPIAHAGPNRCFACGADNPDGLHLEFLLAPDGSVVCFPAVSESFVGYPGYLHGGIIATLLDEAMSKAPFWLTVKDCLSRFSQSRKSRAARRPPAAYQSDAGQ